MDIYSKAHKLHEHILRCDDIQSLYTLLSDFGGKIKMRSTYYAGVVLTDVQ